MTAVLVAAKVALAATLIMAGIAKLGTLPAFAGTIRQFLGQQGFPTLSVPLAGTIAVAEVAVGTASLWLAGRRAPDVAMALMCAALLATAVFGYVRRRGQACHCFGGLAPGTFGWQTIARCAVMLAAALLVLIAPIRTERLAGLGGAAAQILTVATVALIGLAVAAAARTLRFAREME